MERGIEEFVKFTELIERSLNDADYKLNYGETDCGIFWRENVVTICDSRDGSKFNISHFVIVNRNESVIDFVSNRFENLSQRISMFGTDHNLFSFENGAEIDLSFTDESSWFYQLSQEVFAYSYWFKELIEIPKIDVKASPEIAPKEQHVNIFKRNGFILFDHLMNNCTTKFIKTDIGFFYRKMENEYLKVGEGEFREWIKSVYAIEMKKIKSNDTMETFYKARRDNYSIGLEWFKSQ